MENEKYVLVLFLVTLVPVVVVLILIAIDMHKNNSRFTRGIPEPPKHLKKTQNDDKKTFHEKNIQTDSKEIWDSVVRIFNHL